jgi:Raf kinase inhibitor-like YbhB/YbcL family protein
MFRFGYFITVVIGGAAISGAADALNLTSPDLQANGRFADEQAFDGWGCAGKNISPALSWTEAPAGTKSFAISVYDPEAPTGSGFWHWWVANIPANVSSLAKGAGDGKGLQLPNGSIQLRNDFSLVGYSGPCPIKGTTHHYLVTLFALDVEKLDINSDSSPAFVGFNVHAHTLEKVVLTGVWGR